MTLQDLLNKSEELDKAATEGPWTTSHRNGLLPDTPTLYDIIESKKDPIFTFLGSYVNGPISPARGDFTAIDAELITHMRNTHMLYVKALRCAIEALEEIEGGYISSDYEGKCEIRKILADIQAMVEKEMGE